MNRETKSLICLELRNLYGWNKFRHTKEKKARHRYLLLMAVWLLLGAFLAGYTGALTYGLIRIGMSRIVPAYLAVIVSFLIVVLGIFRAGNQIFAKKGYDILCALPLSQSSVVFSRFFVMYVEYLILTVSVMLPGMAVYAYCVRPGAACYLTLLAVIVFVPMLPLVLVTVIGTVVMAVSARMKHKTMAQTLLMLAVVLAIVVGSFRAEQMPDELSLEMLAQMAGGLEAVICHRYPPAEWITGAVADGNWLKLLLLIAASIIPVLLLVIFVSCNFHRICRMLYITNAKHDYQITILKNKGAFSALFRRELRRYFASSIYVTNTIIGPILATVMAAAVLAGGMERIQHMLPLPIDVAGLLPFLFGAVFTMMTTTASSISMEGQQIWIAKTLPVSTKMIMDSKIMVGLVIALPFYVLSEILFVLALKPAGWDLLWLFVVPAVLIVFANVLGITVNRKLHSFDWEKEEAVVKQSASAMLGGLGGMLVSVVCAGCVIALPVQWEHPVKAGICAIMAGITVILYRSNHRILIQEL